MTCQFGIDRGHISEIENGKKNERKDDMKRRGLASPDLGDTLAMTFAVRPSTRRFQPRERVDYDAFRSGRENLWMLS